MLHPATHKTTRTVPAVLSFGDNPLFTLFVVYTSCMNNEKIITDFTDHFRKLVLEHKEEVRVLKQENFNVKRQNGHLLTKLRVVSDKAEVNNNEIYLVDKIEILEAELAEKDLLIESMRKNILVDNAETE